MNTCAIAVTGASGQIAYFLLPRLSQSHAGIAALARHRPAWKHDPAIAWHSVDLAQGWPEALGCRQLIHAGPLGLLPELIPAAARQGLRRLIAFSSTSALGKADSPDPAERRQASELLRAEQALTAACERGGVAWTLFRPTLIYGAGLDRNLSTLAGLIRRLGFTGLPGPGRGLRQPVHADDLALACVQALACPATAGQIYALGGGTTLRYREMVEAVFRALGRKPRIVSLPGGLCRMGLAALRYLPAYRQLSPALIQRIERDQVVDSSRAARDFGYAPRPFAPDAACFQRPG